MEKRMINVPVKIIIDDDQSRDEVLLTVGDTTINVSRKLSGDRRWCREYSPYGECYSYTSGSGKELPEDLEEIIADRLRSMQ